jgi:alkanesulfonate monooxygenase SsuD/methylene tetrahydromethanopterin reductase-like flavin-dependent oxidoreductase (luciferase family)
MELALTIITQGGVTWTDWCAIADTCEESGIPTLFAADHYLSPLDELGSVSHDAWTVIAGLAARTTTLRLGTLVTPVTFRHPAALANAVATADHISGGRIELGLGSGWMDREHEAFGFPFPEPRTRRQMLAEQLEIIHRLWTEERVTFHGDHYTLENAPGRPKPVQSPCPPIIVGASTMRGSTVPAALFADEYNTAWLEHPREFAGMRARVIRVCEEVGREPGTMRFSVAIHCVVGASHDEAMDRVRAIYELRPRDQTFDHWFVGFSESRLVGSVDEMAAALRPYAEAGADRLMIMHILHRDLESIQLIGEQLSPLLAASQPVA